jgi:hypothetical protein
MGEPQLAPTSRSIRVAPCGVRCARRGVPAIGRVFYSGGLGFRPAAAWHHRRCPSYHQYSVAGSTRWSRRNSFGLPCCVFRDHRAPARLSRTSISRIAGSSSQRALNYQTTALLSWLRIRDSGAPDPVSSWTSPVRILATRIALATVSAGRFWPCGPLGIVPD